MIKIDKGIPLPQDEHRRKCNRHVCGLYPSEMHRTLPLST